MANEHPLNPKDHYSNLSRCPVYQLSQDVSPDEAMKRCSDPADSPQTSKAPRKMEEATLAGLTRSPPSVKTTPKNQKSITPKSTPSSQIPNPQTPRINTPPPSGSKICTPAPPPGRPGSKEEMIYYILSWTKLEQVKNNLNNNSDFLSLTTLKSATSLIFNKNHSCSLDAQLSAFLTGASIQSQSNSSESLERLTENMKTLLSEYKDSLVQVKDANRTISEGSLKSQKEMNATIDKGKALINELRKVKDEFQSSPPIPAVPRPSCPPCPPIPSNFLHFEFNGQTVKIRFEIGQTPKIWQRLAKSDALWLREYWKDELLQLTPNDRWIIGLELSTIMRTLVQQRRNTLEELKKEVMRLPGSNRGKTR
uniref:Uncharacterized protein n=1 Tax=Cacopsylla melanoneura TaxID=428564 RepID=A0A8D8M7U5_9HEMI